MIETSLAVGIAVGAFAGGVAVGAIACYMANKTKNSQNFEREKLLSECFGEPITVGTFTLAEFRDWVKGRKELLEKGAKAVALKANDKTLKALNQNLNLGKEVDNFLIMAIIEQSTNKIVQTALIKYDVLENELSDLLDKGDGMVVITA